MDSHERYDQFGLGVCNTMAGSNASGERGVAILKRTLAAFPGAVIVGVVEASNLLGMSGWKPQDDERRLRKIQNARIDKAGVAAIVDYDRVEIIKSYYRLGVVPYIRGRRIAMRTRWILVLVVRIDGRKRKRRVKVAHLPPKRYWALWATMMARLGPRGADLADFNKLARAVLVATGKKTYMSRLIGMALPRRWVAYGPVVRDVKADHKAVYVSVDHHPADR